MRLIFWWFRQLLIFFVSGFFLFGGIRVLIDSYSLDNPFSFIMYFFSASLLILVSAAFMLYPIFKIHGHLTGHSTSRSFSLKEEDEE